MESIVQKIKEAASGPSPDSLLSTLRETNAQWDQNLVVESEQEKAACVQTLLELLRTSENRDVHGLVLQGLRLLCRESSALRPLAEEENLRLLAERTCLAQLEEMPVQVASEGCRCLVNVTIQHIKLGPALMECLVRLHIIEHALAALERPTVPEACVFPLVRLLLQTAARSEAIKGALLEGHIITTLVAIIERLASRHHEPEARLTLKDALALFFVVTQHLGPLEGPQPPSDDELAAFTRVIPCLQGLLSLPKEEEDTRSVVSATLKAMINIPAACTDDFEQEKTLQDMLDFTVLTLSQGEPEAPDLTPVLLILTSISRAIPASHRMIKDRLMPQWESHQPTNNMVDLPEALADPDSVGHRLVSCLTSPNPGLSHYSGELLFAVCQEDADEFVRLIGLGHAAGLLANRGLLSNISARMPSAMPRGPPPDITEEDVQKWHDLMDRIEKHNARQ